jgi:hypothetical protein
VRSTLPIHHFPHLVSFLLPVVGLALLLGLLLNLWLKESGELLSLVLTCEKPGRKKVDFAQANMRIYWDCLRAPPQFVVLTRDSVVVVLLIVVFRLHSLPTCPLYAGQLCWHSKDSMGVKPAAFAF